MIRVLFFAKLRESLGQSEYQAEIAESPLTVAALRECILSARPDWRESLCAPNVIVACNQEVVGLESRVSDGDEVAFYPPVTGG